MANDRERRLCILFHESEILGAGLSVLRTLDKLRSDGWRISGWFPGSGPLVDEAGPALVSSDGTWMVPSEFSPRRSSFDFTPMAGISTDIGRERRSHGP